MCLFFSFYFPSPPSSPSSSVGAISALSFSLVAALRDIWIVGSHLPHYHTNRPLTRAQPSSCALVTYGLAGDQLKSGPGSTIVRSERARYRSYALAREPLAWGTRRKSIILNHSVIGSNDQTTACRASLRGDSRGRATSHLSTSRREDLSFFYRRDLLKNIINVIINVELIMIN